MSPTGLTPASSPEDDAAPGSPAHEPPPPGPLIVEGNSADIYALGEDRVVRRARDGRDTTEEAVLMRYAHSRGFAAPEVLDASGPDIVMVRLFGPTLLQVLVAEQVPVPAGARLLADMHTRLHAFPAPDATLWPVVDDAPVILHMALHPANIIIADEVGPVLVDWSRAEVGPAALDVAMTALVIAEVAVDADAPYASGAKRLLVSFLAATPTDPRPQLAEAEQRRENDYGLVPGEKALLPLAAEMVWRYATAANAARPL